MAEGTFSTTGVMAESNGTITLAPTGPTTLVAYSKTLVTNASLVTVHTTEPNGIPITGIWTTATRNGTVVAGGYTPFTFVATKGEPYSVMVAEYGTYSFDSWENGPGTQNITISPTADQLLNAYLVNATSTPAPWAAARPATAPAGSTLPAPHVRTRPSVP